MTLSTSSLPHATRLSLTQYPEEIARQAKLILKLREKLRTTKEAIARLDAQIEVDIASDTTLKNDQARKAYRLSQTKAEDYQNLLTDLRIEEGSIAKAEIWAERLRNEFSIIKLRERREIAELMQINDF